MRRLDRLITDGFTPRSTCSIEGWGAAAAFGAAGAIGGGLIANANSGIPGWEKSEIQTEYGEQQSFEKQLKALIANPSTFLSNPLFTSTLNLGLGTASRGMAASGMAGSGNEAAELEQYGQTFASGQLGAQESLLASLSGLSTTAAGINAASGGANTSAVPGITSGALNSLALALGIGSGSPGGGGGGGGGSNNSADAILAAFGLG